MPFNNSKYPGRLSLYLTMAGGILLEAGFLSLIFLGNLTGHAGEYLALCTGTFLLYGIAAYSLLGPSARSFKVEAILIVLGFGLLFRLTTLFVAPTLSTDQFRYTWEGKLVTLGVSPYRYAPADPALEPYRSDLWTLVQQKETASPYPPLAQAIGATEYLFLGESLLGPKIAAVIFDYLNCLALLWLLRLYRLDPRLLILYAWCPLPVLEFGISGHNDAPMLFFLLLATGLAHKRRPAFSALFLGVACLAKFTPLFALPLFLVEWAYPRWDWKLAWRWKILRYPLLFMLVILLGYLPFLIMGKGAIGSILEYTGSWRDNESLAYQLTNDLLSPLIAKVLSLVMLIGAICLLTFHPRLSRLSLPQRLVLLFGVILLVASTVHAWYVCWVVVLVPLAYPHKGLRGWNHGWLLFALLVQLPYLSYAGDLSVYNWVKPLEYIPLYLAFAWNWFELTKRSTAHQEVLLEESQLEEVQSA